MARTYAPVPHSYLEEMAGLTNAEFGRLIRALLRYSATGEPIRLKGREELFARRVAAQEEWYRDSYEEKVRQCSLAGKASAESRRRQRERPLTDVNKEEEEEKEKEKEHTPPPTGGEGYAREGARRARGRKRRIPGEPSPEQLMHDVEELERFWPLTR